MNWVVTLQAIFQVSSVPRSAAFHFAFFAGPSFFVILSKKRPHERTFLARSYPIQYILDFLHDLFLSNYINNDILRWADANGSFSCSIRIIRIIYTEVKFCLQLLFRHLRNLRSRGFGFLYYQGNIQTWNKVWFPNGKRLSPFLRPN